MLEKLKMKIKNFKEHRKKHWKQISNRKLYRKLLELENLVLGLKADEIRQNKEKIFSFNTHFDGRHYKPKITFYLPQALSDFIQSSIVKTNNFFDIDIIEKVDKYFENKANILDIGANIGNNSIYYALLREAKKVYAFEPIETSYQILNKNVRLNGLEETIQTYNFALGEKESKASISCYPYHNIGATSLQSDENGNLYVKSLDELENEGFFKEKIDFVKIDVEGFEEKILLGGGFLKKT